MQNSKVLVQQFQNHPQRYTNYHDNLRLVEQIAAQQNRVDELNVFKQCERFRSSFDTCRLRLDILTKNFTFISNESRVEPRNKNHMISRQ